MKFLRHFNLPLVAAVFFAGVIATMVFTLSRPRSNDDEILAAAKRLENRRLPVSILDRINEKNFLVVYLSSGCKGCSDELGLLSELQADSPGLKLFGVMVEDEAAVKDYIRDKDIRFPVIRDGELDMMRDLKLEFFPTHLWVEDGTIKRAYIGVTESKETLLALTSH